MSDNHKARAKFRLDEVRATTMTRYEQQPDGTQKTVPRELRTLVFNPVGKDSSPENALFWQYTPTGRLELGTINPEVWSRFELGKEYYLDLSTACTDACIESCPARTPA